MLSPRLGGAGGGCFFAATVGAVGSSSGTGLMGFGLAAAGRGTVGLAAAGGGTTGLAAAGGGATGLEEVGGGTAGFPVEAARLIVPGGETWSEEKDSLRDESDEELVLRSCILKKSENYNIKKYCSVLIFLFQLPSKLEVRS